MKIGVISDIHFDRNLAESEGMYLNIIAATARGKDVELLIIAGDISADHIKSYQFVKKLKEKTGLEVLFVPGNHDLWSDERITREIFEYYKEKPECLLAGPYLIGTDWAIVGHTAWYDYSYASDRFTTEQFERGSYKGGVWQDKVKIDWGKSDIEMSKQFAAETKGHLEQVKDRRIILVTHIVTHKKFRVPMPNRVFDFFNAYIGTSDFTQFYEQYPIKYSVMGHIHFRNNFIENGTHYICSCLGYKREWRSDDIVREIADAMFVIDLVE